MKTTVTFTVHKYKTSASWPAWLIAASLLSIAGGCGGGSGSANEHGNDEQLEHFVPPHKPANFAVLIEQLELRIPQLAGKSSTDDRVKNSTAVQELSDIFGWIPELAADSELCKADFEHATAAGVRLQELVQQSFGPQSKAQDLAKFEPLLEELRVLVAKAIGSMP